MILLANILSNLGFALLLMWVLGIVGGLLAYMFGGKHKRKRKVFLAAITPALAIGIWIAGSLLTSIMCGVNLGIGDSWEAHLPNGYKLVSINDTEHGYITYDDQKITISDDKLSTDINAEVTKIQVIGDTIIGINQDGCISFVINTSKRSINLLDLDKDKRIASMIDNGNLLKVQDFFWKSKKTPLMIGTIITLIVIILALFLLWKKGLAIQPTRKKRV